jgi:hypothetical protein
VTETAVEGGCFCGAIRYRAEGKPTNTMVCHCRSCRRVAAAPVTAWLTFPTSEFRFTRGKPKEFSSSEPVRRSFCESCGTMLTYAHRKHPQTIDVATCSLDDPNAYPPTHHSWLEDNIAWVKFGDGLPTFQKSRKI